MITISDQTQDLTVSFPLFSGFIYYCLSFYLSVYLSIYPSIYLAAFNILIVCKHALISTITYPLCLQVKLVVHHVTSDVLFSSRANTEEAIDSPGELFTLLGADEFAKNQVCCVCVCVYVCKCVCVCM
jgi:hypothetical protein